MSAGQSCSVPPISVDTVTSSALSGVTASRTLLEHTNCVRSVYARCVSCVVVVEQLRPILPLIHAPVATDGRLVAVSVYRFYSA